MRYKIHILLFTFWALTVTLASTFLSNLVSATAEKQSGWVLTHVLNPQTADGIALAKHLLSRQVLVRYNEVVVLTSPQKNLERQLQLHGYTAAIKNLLPLKNARSQENLQFDSPFYVMTSPQGHSLLAANYRSPEQDFSLIKNYMNEPQNAWLPLWSCGQTLSVQNFINPQALILKRRTTAQFQ